MTRLKTHGYDEFWTKTMQKGAVAEQSKVLQCKDNEMNFYIQQLKKLIFYGWILRGEKNLMFSDFFGINGLWDF